MLINNACNAVKKSAFLLCATTLAGCATGAAHRIVEPGDQVAIHFTCRLPNGEIAADTRPDLARTHPVAPIYLERSGDDPLVVEAGLQGAGDQGAQRRSFELEIVERLAGAVIGAREGSTLRLDLDAPRISGLPLEEQYVKMVRVRRRAKEMKMSRAQYLERTGKEPAVGDPFRFDPLVPGEVRELSATEVVIHFTAPPDSEVVLPFGKGVIRDREDHYDIEINAVKGTLVRAGGIVGRVSEVDGGFIVLDFGHPFGGETLSCELTVASAKPDEKRAGASAADAQPGAAVQTVKSL